MAEEPALQLALSAEEGAAEGDELWRCRSRSGPTLITVSSPVAGGRSPREPIPSHFNREDMVLRYGLHSVQGQRDEMEDDHKCIHGGRSEPETPDCRHQTGEGWAPPAEEDQDYNPHPDTSFFGVYDGHAGTEAAAFLRQHLHRAILRHPRFPEDPELAAREGIAEVERQFMTCADAQHLDAGSTLAIALIVGTELVTANVGDSEVVLNRGGAPVVLSTIHNMRKNAREEERVQRAGGRVHHQRLAHPRYNPQFFSIAVTRSIGDAFFKAPQFTEGRPSGLISDADTCRVSLTRDDRFVLIGCDGLWDVMSYQEAIDFAESGLASGKSCQAVTEDLVNHALHLGSTDNITALLITLK